MIKTLLGEIFHQNKIVIISPPYVILKPFDWYKIILIFLVDCLDCLIQMCGQKTHLDISQNKISVLQKKVSLEQHTVE